MADKAQDEAEKAALNPSSGEDAAFKEKLVVRGGIWQTGKNCVSYFSTLSIFTITTLLMIPGLTLACYHQRAQRKRNSRLRHQTEPADSESSDDDHDMPPRGVPQYGVPQYGVLTYPHPGMQNQGYYGHGYGAQMPMPMPMSDPMQNRMYQPHSGKRKNKGKREQGRDGESQQLRGFDV
ncbi:hypothetical protein BPAE_0026g00700 [Botrytis paeoniae]|uniref:Uncharacterized protein n=1 Tax=Botrytis paeoniae TaxID=278948 RepID=A0A4Z1FZ73_9HELO|nr:hypothetical protein BPAE_0026g00700 [Botrytis paeoniae]